MEEYQYVGKYISDIHKSSCIYFNKEFGKIGIGAGEYVFLLSLYKCDGITQEELTVKVKLDKATTARAIKRLEDKGYVRRIKKEEDRRAYKLELTKKADEIREKIYLIMDEWENKVRNCFGNGESEELIKLLNKLAKSSLITKEGIYE